MRNTELALLLLLHRYQLSFERRNGVILLVAQRNGTDRIECHVDASRSVDDALVRIVSDAFEPVK